MRMGRQDLVEEFRRLGVGPGMTLMVHSSLSALGEVNGGADTVIEALLEAIGPTGTLSMPAMGGGSPFNAETSPSTVGVVTEAFRHYPGVKRSLHPTHSTCALGPKADWLLEGQIDQPTAIGAESPCGRLSRLREGYVLLLGVDQDRNTLLHYPEEIVRAPYLSTIERKYLDEAGVERTKVLHHFPGPHRDFIGLDRLFRERGAMKLGKVGKAVCRLLHAGSAVEIEVEALRRDPTAVLCDNPNCDDCVRQRARIKAHDLARYDFTASALLDELAGSLAEADGALQAVANEGIPCIELGPTLGAELLTGGEGPGAQFIAELDAREMAVSCLHCGLTPAEFIAGGEAPTKHIRSALEVAQAIQAPLVKLPSPPEETDAEAAIARLREALEWADATVVTLVFENVPGSCWHSGEACQAPLLALADDHRLGFCFNPGHFANLGEKPFLGTYRKHKLKRFTRALYVTDGCVPGGAAYALPGQGNGEVKELISIFSCRSFDGFLTLKMGDRRGPEAFKAHADAFRRLLEPVAPI